MCIRDRYGDALIVEFSGDGMAALVENKKGIVDANVTQEQREMCIRDRSAISLIIRATGICWNQVVCKGMAGKQRLCLKIKKLSETQRSK